MTTPDTGPLETPEINREPQTIIEDAGIRAQLAPHASLGLLVLAASAAKLAGDATGAGQEITLAVAGVAFVVSVVVAFAGRKKIRDNKLRVRALAFCVGAGAWLVHATVAGVSLDSVGLLALLTYTVSAYWWRAKRIPNRPGRVIDYIASTLEADGVDQYAADWAEFVANADGPVPGSRLTGREDLATGRRYILHVRRGKQTYEMVQGQMKNLRGALYLLRGQDLIVERHPTLPEPTLQVTIVTASPIKTAASWPGPGLGEDGLVPLGPFSDGLGVARWRAWTENSLWGGYITGSAGSGKSRMFEALAMEYAAAGAVVWFLDGDWGASSRLLARHCDHKGLTAEDAAEVLQRTLDVMHVRRKENIVHEWDGWDPGQGRPAVVLFIDECHRIFADPTNQTAAIEIARQGRKVGVAIIAASQVGSLDAFGGKTQAEVLRSNLRAGNAVMLRSMAKSTKVVMSADGIDPTKFPADMPGYGYYLAAEGSNMRQAPFRGFHVTNEVQEKWTEKITWAGLDDVAAEAYGPAYTDRHAREQARRAALAASLLGGGAADLAYTIPKPTQASSAFTLPQFPKWNRPARTNPEDTGRPALTGSEAKVVAAIKAGHTGPGQIAKATGLSDSQVYNLLNKLAADRVVSKAGYGKYEAA